MAFNFPTGVSDGYVWWWGDGIRSWRYRAADQTWVRPAGTALPKNRFTNPALQINDQNGMTDATNVQGLIMAEQLWTYFTFAGAGGTYRGQRVISPTPGGSQYRARITVNVASSMAALAPGDWLVMRTELEASKMHDFQWGDNVAFTPQFVVVRFGWRSPAGTYSFGIKNPAGTEAYSWPFTITPEQANTDTLQIAIIPPNYWEVWPTGNVNWLYCYWTILNSYMMPEGYEWYDSGQMSAPGLSNTFMQTAGNVVELFDIGWYLDPYATGIPPEFEVPHIEEDHQDCLRYWYKAYRFDGVVNSATQGYLWANNYVTMRANPALALNGNLRCWDASVAPNMASFTNYNITPETISILATASGFVTGRPFKTLVDAQTANGIFVNARL